MSARDRKSFDARNRAVDSHKGSSQHWLARHETVCREAARAKGRYLAAVEDTLLKRASDDRNLIVAWDHLKRVGGKAAGPDGVTLADMDGSHHDLLREVRDAIRTGCYRHGATRRVHVAKAGGKGTRVIHIADVVDRVVQRALVQAVQPLLDPRFSDCSFGYRPRLDRLHALAVASHAIQQGYTYVVAEDLSNCFDHVPQSRLMEVVDRYLHGATVCQHIERVVGMPSKHGIRQGGAACPLMLNLYLHHTLDRLWPKSGLGTMLLRYADDLTLLCPSPTQAREAREVLKRLIASAGFTLKPHEGADVHDLADGDAFDWLGYRIGWNWRHGMVVGLSDRAWDRLIAKDREGIDIGRLMLSWADQMGPLTAFDARAQYSALAEFFVADRDEVLSFEEFDERASAARGRWRRLVRRYAPIGYLV